MCSENQPQNSRREGAECHANADFLSPLSDDIRHHALNADSGDDDACSARPEAEVVGLLRRKVAEIDPALPVFKAASMSTVISTRLNNRRAIMILLVSFAAVALLLAAIGIYGVLAYDVSQRTREIGIRGAIGATREQIVALILRQGLWKAIVGLIVGLGGALLLSRYLATLLFDMRPTDPLAYMVVTLLLLGVAILASYLPARRAARIDPIIALRSE
jgi:putative ABC transport system permease protein